MVSKIIIISSSLFLSVKYIKMNQDKLIINCDSYYLLNDIELKKKFAESENFKSFIFHRIQTQQKNWDKYFTKEQQQILLNYSLEDILTSLIKQSYEITLTLLNCFEMALNFDETNTDNFNVNAIYYCKNNGLYELENLFLITNHEIVLEDEELQFWLLACIQAYKYQEVLITAVKNPISKFTENTKQWISNSTAIELLNEKYNSTYNLTYDESSEIWSKLIPFFNKTKDLIHEDRQRLLSEIDSYRIIRKLNRCVKKRKMELPSPKLDYIKMFDYMVDVEQAEQFKKASEICFITDKNDKYRDFFDPSLIWFLSTPELIIKQKIANFYHFDLYFNYFVLPFCLEMSRKYPNHFMIAYCKHLVRGSIDLNFQDFVQQFNLDSLLLKTVRK
jgi:hypothetical protein